MAGDLVNQPQNFHIQSVDDLSRIANMMAGSGYFSDAKDATQAGVKVLAGAELGIPALAAMTGIHIIKGRVTLSANLMAACVKRSGRYNFKVKEHNAEKCAIEFFEDGQSIGVSEFTMDDAKTANLGGDNWKKYPRNMLYARAISNGVRFHCPDVFLGTPTYTPDELGANVNADGEAIAVEAEIVEEPKSSQVGNLEPRPYDRIVAANESLGYSNSQISEFVKNAGVNKSANLNQQQTSGVIYSMCLDRLSSLFEGAEDVEEFLAECVNPFLGTPDEAKAIAKAVDQYSGGKQHEDRKHTPSLD